MILTVTPNPSLDLLFDADRLVWDDANRIPMPRRRVGGQGVNLVRAVRALDPGAPALAVAPMGGAVGRELRSLLEDEGTPAEILEIDGDTRVFVGVRERGTGRALLLNPRGPEVEADVGERVLDVVGRRLAEHGGGWVVCCGSLLPGLPVDLHARIGALAREHGFRFVPDCDGPALAEAAAVGPELLVPNAHEAGRLVGRAVDGVDAALQAARDLMQPRSAGLAPPPRRVAVTLGAEGAVAVDAGGGWWARPELLPELARQAESGSAVGAGDAFLAALILALDAAAPLDRALVEAVATGTASLLSRGTDLVRAEDVGRVRPHVRLERRTG